MSRGKIGAVVVVVVAILTAAAYFLTTQRLKANIRTDVKDRVANARSVVFHGAELEGFEGEGEVEKLARDGNFLLAIEQGDPAQRAAMAGQAIRDFKAGAKHKPDYVALTDKDGWVIYMDPPLPDRENWKQQFPIVAKALDEGRVWRDIWDYRNAVTKAFVAPIRAAGADAEVKGAVIVAYALNATSARATADMLGLHVAYFLDNRVRATSFRNKGAEGDTSYLTKALTDKGLGKLEGGKSPPVTEVTIRGERYLATAVKLPYDNPTAGAMVLKSLDAAYEPLSIVQWTIILLGAGAILVAILAMLMAARTLLNPAEQIELGVAEIINGNVDYTFKPAGEDFDGLANSLNVMLARLLGRPEPGDDDFDEERATVSSQVLLDDESTQPVATAAMGGDAALASEPEADYYKRLYGEFMEARNSAGEKTEGVTFESFVAKLRISEANLKKKYSCRIVRFRVTTKDGQVTLKPVPMN